MLISIMSFLFISIFKVEHLLYKGLRRMKSNIEPLAFDNSCSFNYFSLLIIVQNAAGH